MYTKSVIRKILSDFSKYCSPEWPGRKYHMMVFSFIDPIVLTVASETCSWLTAVESNVVFTLVCKPNNNVKKYVTLPYWHGGLVVGGLNPASTLCVWSLRFLLVCMGFAYSRGFLRVLQLPLSVQRHAL